MRLCFTVSCAQEAQLGAHPILVHLRVVRYVSAPSLLLSLLANAACLFSVRKHYEILSLCTYVVLLTDVELLFTLFHTQFLISC